MEYLLKSDPVGWVFSVLFAWLILVIASFARRHLRGIPFFVTFLLPVMALAFVLDMLTRSDHLALFLLFWVLSITLFLYLMRPHTPWPAAYASAKKATWSLLISTLCIGSICGVLYAFSKDCALCTTCWQQLYFPYNLFAASLLCCGTFIQSGIWPFHRWLLGISNTSTPVLALVHSILTPLSILLLVRFAPLYHHDPLILQFILVVSLISTCGGTLLQMMQQDTRRTLAFSTIGHNGFSIVLCALGLFPAAILHTCGHALYKAYQILSARASAQTPSQTLFSPPSFVRFATALLCGGASAGIFSYTSGLSFLRFDTSIFLGVLVTIASTHLFLSCTKEKMWKELCPALLITLGTTIVYGLLLSLSVAYLAPVIPWLPQPLSSIHTVILCLLCVAWLLCVFWRPYQAHFVWRDQIYVWLLTFSQPHALSITTHRARGS